MLKMVSLHCQCPRMGATQPRWRITKIKQSGGAAGGDSGHRAEGPDPVRPSVPLERARASEGAGHDGRRRRRRRGDGVGAHMLKKFV